MTTHISEETVCITYTIDYETVARQPQEEQFLIIEHLADVLENPMWDRRLTCKPCELKWHPEDKELPVRPGANCLTSCRGCWYAMLDESPRPKEPRPSHPHADSILCLRPEQLTWSGGKTHIRGDRPPRVEAESVAPRWRLEPGTLRTLWIATWGGKRLVMALERLSEQ